MKYTAVIRTLGTAGNKYQCELDSLCIQTIPPEEIIVYIAEGSSLPKETCGHERYVIVPKGMVAQRALQYTEVTTDYILFLDDDLKLPPDFAEHMFNVLKDNNADVVSADIFPNHNRSLKSELIMSISARMRARRLDNKWGYKVMRSGGYSYNKNPIGSLLSQTNAGANFLCKKEDFLNIHFEEETWIDRMGYAVGDDQVMFYKMYLMGLKQMTLYNSGIEHLDGSGNMTSKEKTTKVMEADYFFRKVFIHRFLLPTQRNFCGRVWTHICFSYFLVFGIMSSIFKGDMAMLDAKKKGLRKAQDLIESSEYKSLPVIIRK